MSYLLIAVSIALVECILAWFVLTQRKKFQWIITSRDELPEFDSLALEKFIRGSFDPTLGWVRKPDTDGFEIGQKGKIHFFIDSSGSRANKFSKRSPAVVAYGDSYAFCRQVEDDETWEAQLAEMKDISVSNFGVGNYGVDQALLRYESMQLPDTVKIVVMGFVPETICRVQSYWKHYLEFGNTFAFKPRFILDSGGELQLLDNSMQSLEDFSRLQEKLPEIRKYDGFYHRKFRSMQYRFPFLFSLLRNPRKQISLIIGITVRGILRCLGRSGKTAENLPFLQVMKSNIRDAHALYRDPESCKLLIAIFSRFRQEAESRGHLPLLLVMPQLLDLKLTRADRAAPYQRFYAELSPQIPVLDVTDTFRETGYEKLYIDDQYGGHLSVEGNRIVARQLSAWLKHNGFTASAERD